MAAERAAHSVPVGVFQSEEECFEDWIKMFEDAVLLATNAPADRKEALYRKWLPLKLDKRTRDLLKNCTEAATWNAATWEALKTELKDLLVDPQEKYNWQINKSSVQWDGKENFHSLANKIKRLVNLYHDGAEKDTENFFRFRMSLPTDYRRAIDLGCDEKKRTLDEAKKMAFRFQMSQADSAPTANNNGNAMGKNVSFTGAVMSENRLKSVEMALEGVSVRCDNLESDTNKKPRDQAPSRDNSKERQWSRGRSDRDGRYGYREQTRSRDSSRGSSYCGRQDDPSRYERDSRDDSGRDRRNSWGDSGRYQRDRREDRSARKGDSSEHKMASLDFEPMFRKFCSMVVDNTKQDGPEN